MKTQLFFLKQILRIVILFAITLTGVYFVSHLADINFFHDIVTPATNGLKNADGNWVQYPEEKHLEWSVLHCWCAILGGVLFVCSLVATILMIVIDTNRNFPNLK